MFCCSQYPYSFTGILLRRKTYVPPKQANEYCISLLSLLLSPLFSKTNLYLLYFVKQAQKLGPFYKIVPSFPTLLFCYSMKSDFIEEIMKWLKTNHLILRWQIVSCLFLHQTMLQNKQAINPCLSHLFC